MSTPVFSYSAFIPRVFSNITEARIVDAFDKLQIGSVNRVDLIHKTSKTGDAYNMAFVHFAMIYNTSAGETFRRELEGSDRKTKVMYDDPWFWNILPFEQKETRPRPEEARVNTPSYPAFDPVNCAPQQDVAPQFYNATTSMVPFWMMTAYGPVLQMGYPHHMPPSQPQDRAHESLSSRQSIPQMVPPQVAYGNRINKQRNYPRKRLNAPSYAESRKTTHASENATIDVDGGMEDGEC